jgi:alpha-L-arabinofuranosidase
VDSTWGAVRAQMGHPEPFHLHHVAVGNEDCGLPHYKGSENFQSVTVTETMHDLCFFNDYKLVQMCLCGFDLGLDQGTTWSFTMQSSSCIRDSRGSEGEGLRRS